MEGEFSHLLFDGNYKTVIPTTLGGGNITNVNSVSLSAEVPELVPT